jgi:hypothetical protein
VPISAAKEEDERRALSARQAALARAADADREAALAQQEHDAAEARVRAAQSAQPLLLPSRRMILVRLALPLPTTSHLQLLMLLFTTRQPRC